MKKHGASDCGLRVLGYWLKMGMAGLYLDKDR